MKKIFIKLLTLSVFVASSMSGLVGVANAAKYPEFCSVFNRTLSFGDTGQDVKMLQIVMGQEGIAYLGGTGYYGEMTTRAVKVFQLRNEILSTGNVGPITFARMKLFWCSNDGGGGGGGPIVGVPDVTLIPSVSYGQNVTLTWTGTNVSSCNLNGTTVQPIGQTSVVVNTQVDYTITCQSLTGQTVSKTVTLRPNQNSGNLPTVTVSINPTSVLVNSYATLYWTSTNANSCTINGQLVSTSGSQQIYVTNTNTAYTVTCTGYNGQQVSNTVYPGGGYNNGNMSANIYVSNSNITAGAPTTLSWNSVNAYTCSVTGGNNYFTGTSGSQTVYPTTNTTYTITCNSTTGQTISNQVTVYIGGNNGGNVTATLSANPTNITYAGQMVTLNWTSSNASYCNLTANGNTLVTNQAANGYYVVYPTTGTNYVVNCYNYNGQNNSAFVYVTLNGTGSNNVTAALTANPSSIASGQNTNLIWSATNASYCNLVNTTNNITVLTNQSVSGNYIPNPALTSTTNYQVTCYNSSGQSAVANALVTVSGNGSGITTTMSANPTSITSGQNSTLSWSATGANYCNLTNITAGSILANNQAISGTFVVTPNTTTNYQVTCYNTAGQSAYSNVTVTVTNTSGITTTMTANPTSITSGQSSILTWSATGANYCNLNNITTGASILTNQGITGTYSVSPTTTTNYQVICYNTSGQSNSSNATVTVGGTGGRGNIILKIDPVSSVKMSDFPTWLHITALNVRNCTLNGGEYSNAYFPNSTLNDDWLVNPKITTTYTATCRGVNGTTATESSTVNVSDSAGSSGIRIVSNVDNDVTINVNTRAVNYGQNTIIDWGDNTTSPVTFTYRTIYSALGLTHTYATAGTYTIKHLQSAGGKVLSSSTIVTEGSNNSGNSIGIVVRATPADISVPGQAVRISWTSTNATYCTVKDPSGTVLSSNSLPADSFVVYPRVTGEYLITCYNGSVSAKKAIAITVNGSLTGLPSVKNDPTAIGINAGQTLRITVGAYNVRSCSVTGGSLNNKPIGLTENALIPGGFSSGSFTVAPIIPTVFTVTCLGTNGQTVSAKTTVAIKEPTGIVSVGVTASPAVITAYGQPSKIAWLSSNAKYCSVAAPSGAILNPNAPTTGNLLVYPTVTGYYVVTCFNDTTSGKGSALVSISSSNFNSGYDTQN